MKTAGCVTFVHLLIAITLGSIGATQLTAQEYVRDSEPKLFFYDELVQLSLDQGMSPEGNRIESALFSPVSHHEWDSAERSQCGSA
jgi:hypothetical protein